MTRRQIARRRAADAYDVLLGRPVRPGYGMLVVVPLFAAAGGALIGLGVDILVTQRRTAAATAQPAPSPRLEPVSA
ncbi:hypothetical protein ACWT_3847 [Actinoplanes sp. SE50]|uniref:hypothetical protein n=1 Tax=unclassified Actinoplanes TaxID=2626549 RepID=UPI00023ECEA7|nr:MULTISPECIES: hypothetical protein [unclassified Actinoplanes]AEV84871.1 hypothetical protein ACPL_3976 [Actinoplanes sp. SE50/110]ATO83262.1 hypothetical protein ACWT_3847 [Actinoplanes sp. SE50]SLM00669.1 uncharacterized protein ACSP50_3902 [Actinoplanes sp. SE50/110]